MLIDFFWWDDITEGQKPYANFKTAYFVKYLSSFMTNFHETSLTRIPLIRQHNERQQPYANFKTAHVVKYIGSSWWIYIRLL